LGLFDNLQEASRGIVVNQPDIVLLDEAFPDGPMAVRRIRDFIPQIPVVVIAAAETPVEIIAWAEAGVGGYIPRTAGIADVVPRLIGIMRDCSESGAAGLLRRISNVGATNGEHRNTSLPPMLTPREAQIVQMIFLGMSNKDIARHLNIGLATTKTHVHHLLGKLNLQRRGQAASWMREHVHHW